MWQNNKILVYLVLILSALLIAFYFYNQNKIEIITIEASQTPHKKRPKERGGVVIPNTDSLIYNQFSFNKNKINFLSSPENPIFLDRIPALNNITIYTDSIDDILNNLEYYEQLYSTENANDATEEDSILPNVISAINTKEEQEKKTNIISHISEGTDLIVEKAKDRRFAKVAVSKNDSDKSGGYKIQLTIARGEFDAQSKWQLIKAKHPKILKGSNLILKKVQGDNGKIFYLVMSGPYPSLNKAQLTCRQLISKK